MCSSLFSAVIAPLHKPRKVALLAMLIFLAVLDSTLFVHPVQAATITVSSTCTLDNAIRAANTDAATSGCTAGSGDDTITVSGTVTLSAALPAITTNITISGGSGGGTIDGANTYRVLFVSDGHLTLNNMTITKGRVTDARGYGAGIYVQGDDTTNKDPALTLTGVTVSSNTVTGRFAGGGGLYFNSSGALTITDSTFSSNNSSDSTGGAISVLGSDTAGAKTITGSVFSGNSSEGQGAAIQLTEANSSVTIQRSSFHGNSNNSQFGIVGAANGVVIKNSTFTGNSSSHASGRVIWARVATAGETASLEHVTVAGNTTTHALGGTNGAGTFNVYNSVIADGSGDDCDVTGGFDAHAGNLIEDNTCSPSPALMGDPKLKATHTGSPPFLWLEADSPLIDAASATQCTAAGNDQRGVSRPVGTACDIGAVEYLPTITVSSACTLANAITSANTDASAGGCRPGDGDDTIVVGSTVTLATALPAITSNITIQGGSTGGTIDGNDAVRGLSVTAGHLTLDNMTITQGKTTGGGNGAGILVTGGSLTVNNSTVSESNAEGSGADGGGIHFTGGGAFTITDSTISNNTALVSAGGLYGRAGTGVVIRDSVFSGNRAADAGAINLGSLAGQDRIERSAIHGNTADTGGIVSATNLLMTNSTLYGNTSSTTLGAVITTFGITPLDVITLSHVTIDGNTATRGIASAVAAPTFNVYNSIIAGAPSAGDDCAVMGGIDDQAGNLIEDNTCSPAVMGDPKLASTAVGSPPYLVPASDSPALDVADATRCAATDQGGTPRPIGDGCDIGAVERADFIVSNSCSLANAITAANTDTATGGCPAGSGDDTILVSGTVTLATALPAITTNITITGNGTIDGNDAVRALSVTDGHLILQNMTITQGKTTGGNDGANIYVNGASNVGGAINDPSLTLINTVVSEGNAEGDNADGAGVWFTSSVGDLTIRDSVIRNNSAAGNGGGLFISSTSGDLVENSVISGNSANHGGAVAAQTNGFTIRRSAIHGNSMTQGSGIIYLFGGINIENSSIYDNSSTNTTSASAIYNFSPGRDAGIAITLTHVTIDGNELVNGITMPATQPGTGTDIVMPFNVYNSIIAGAATAGNDCNVAGGLDGNAGNLIEDNTCTPAVMGDPKLAATAVGDPPYFLPAADSPALDVADATHCATAGADQRGTTRPVGAGCDIGAVEASRPTAAFSFETDGLTAYFNSTPSIGDGAADITYSWSFGEGNAASAEAHPTHTYAAAGSYNVTLTLSNADGSNTSAAQSVTVPVRPTAAFTYGTAGLTVSFDSITSTGVNLGYVWDFGDNSPFSHEANPIHTYAEAGDYSPTLTVYNAGGSHTSPAQSFSLAAGTTMTVSSTCSLADAITAANTDTATGGCPAGNGDDVIVVSGTVTLAEALPNITSNITINGGGTIDGDNNYRVLRAADGHLWLDNMTLTKGASEFGSGLRVSNTGRATVTGSVFHDNNLYPIALTSATVATIKSSAIHSNGTSDAEGSGALSTTENTSITVENSTIYSNTGGAETAVAHLVGTSVLRHVTMVNNTGDGLRENTNVVTGALRIYNSVIAGSSGVDCLGWTTQANNLIEDSSCSPALSGAPGLAASAAGSPGYFLPGAGSPTLGAGDPIHCAAAGLDQRGNARPIGGACDIGAVQMVAPNPTTITVSATCTLANAITAANTDTATSGCPAGNGDDTIVVSGTETLTAALPAITESLTISGGGTGTIDGNDAYRVLNVSDGHLRLEDMIITQGSATGGGGIQVRRTATSAPSLTLINTTVSESASPSSDTAGGGIYFVSSGVLNMVNSRIINNTAPNGGGMWTVAGSTTIISGSVFSGNGTGANAAINASGNISINRSAFHGNVASSATTRTGVIDFTRYLDMRNSTMYGNSTTTPEGSIAAIYAGRNATEMYLNHVTIAADTLPHGLYSSTHPDADTTFNVYNSIIAGASGNDCNVAGGLDAQAGNLIEDNTCTPAVMGDPMLASTARGSPPFLGPLGGSPAIDAADATQCTAAGNDQRNLARPQGAGCEIGAVESVLLAAFSYTTNSLSVNFDSSDSLGEDLEYSWDFGDGSSPAYASDPNPTHAYRQAGTYLVTLEVSNDDGSNKTDPAQSISVAPGPTAAFIFSVDGLVATFTSRSRGDNLMYSWDFGDNSSPTYASDPNPTHTYTADGVYDVKLEVTNVGGTSTSAPQKVTVSRPPVAAFTFTVSGLEVTFDSSTSTGAGLAYSWNFGDGRRSKEANPTHTYRRSGTYNVTLTLTNVGGRDTWPDASDPPQQVTVVEPPLSRFYARRSGLRVRFYSHGSRGGGNLTYSWNFGDGSSPTYASDPHPLHEYAAEGEYTVRLTLDNGEDDNFQEITLTVAPGIVDSIATPEPERSERKPAKPTVHTGLLINEDLSDGISVWAQHGLTSGIQFQRRELDSIYLIQTANIEAVIGASVKDLIDVWGYTDQEWELCAENSRLGPTGGLMFIESLPHTGKIVYTSPAVVHWGGLTCLSFDYKAGLVALVERAPVPAIALPTATPSPRSLDSNCMVYLNAHLNFRYYPGLSQLYDYVLPAGVALTALERVDGWIKVDFYGDQGWISADYVTMYGDC